MTSHVVTESALRIGRAVLFLGALACSSSEPIRIGVVVSAEGVAGARVAEAAINASGGIRGRPLALRVMLAGGATLAGPALAAADSLARDPSVIGVVGHSNSSASLSGSQVYNSAGVVQIAPTSSAPLLSLAGPYTFRLAPSDVYQARFLAREAATGGGAHRTAVIYVNDDYGHALRDELLKDLGSRDVPVVYQTGYIEQDVLADPAGIVRAVSDADPELLVWIGRAGQLRQVMPGLRAKLPRLRVLASDAISNAETDRNADGVLTGVEYVCLLDLGATSPSLDTLRAQLLATAGLPLTTEAALTYDAVMLLATAARAAGPQRAAIRDYLAQLGTGHPAYSGATGVITFDKNGDPPPSYCLAEVTAQGVRTRPARQ